MQAGQCRRFWISSGNAREVDVVGGNVAVAINKLKAAVAHVVDGDDVVFHHLHIHRYGPITAVDGMASNGCGVACAQGHGRNHGGVARCRGTRQATVVCVYNDVHVALAAQQHFALAVARGRAKPHDFWHLAQDLGLSGDELNELSFVRAQRLTVCGQRFAVGS